MQRTINKSVSISGVGLHTGQMVTLNFKPAKANEGIVFVRTDIAGKPAVKLQMDNILLDEKISRCSVIESNGIKIVTVEHLLAALHGLGIDNITIEISSEELPGLDGSSLDYVKLLQSAEICSLDVPRNYLEVKYPIFISKGSATILALPDSDFNVNYSLDYDHPLLKNQSVSFCLSEEIFINEIAPSRTFCLESEAEEIKARGLGKGANTTNTLVMSATGPIDNTLRYADECARHKLLDIIGDLFLLGRPIRGKVYANKSGHSLNRLLISKIEQQQRNPVMTPSQRVFDINEIMRILPHRYPFLLVDRVIEIEKGKKGIGIKNVTINDGFFQGHFPKKPVMPGVLMVEAMAQTAGVVVLTSGEHPGKVALFMAIDAVKFRKVVSPGDQLIMEVEIVRDRERTAQVKGVGKVDGEVVVEADMLFSYTDEVYLNK